MDLPENGEIIIDSIFNMNNRYIDIKSLLKNAAKRNCTVYFKNESLRIAPNDVNSADTRAILNAYSSVIMYPKAATDYLLYKHGL